MGSLLYHQRQARVVKEHIKKKNNIINNAAALRIQFSPLLQCAFKTFAYVYMKQTSTPFFKYICAARKLPSLEQQTKAAGFWAATKQRDQTLQKLYSLKKLSFSGEKRKYLQQNKGA